MLFVCCSMSASTSSCPTAQNVAVILPTECASWLCSEPGTAALLMKTTSFSTRVTVTTYDYILREMEKIFLSWRSTDINVEIFAK